VRARARAHELTALRSNRCAGTEKRGWTTLYAIPRAPGLPKHSDDLLFEETEDGRAAHLRARKALLQQLE